VGYYLIKKRKGTEAPLSAKDHNEQGTDHAN
jgi:hypothetical protein